MTRRRSLCVLLGLLALPALAVAVPAAADDSRRRGDSGNELLEDIITGVERAIVERYFRRRGRLAEVDRRNLPPGLARKSSLPPGLATQLRERGSLPPGLARRSLPAELYRELPRRTGRRLYLVDNRVVLIEEATNRVLDVIEDFIVMR